MESFNMFNYNFLNGGEEQARPEERNNSLQIMNDFSMRVENPLDVQRAAISQSETGAFDGAEKKKRRRRRRKAVTGTSEAPSQPEDGLGNGNDDEVDDEAELEGLVAALGLGDDSGPAADGDAGEGADEDDGEGEAEGDGEGKTSAAKKRRRRRNRKKGTDDVYAKILRGFPTTTLRTTAMSAPADPLASLVNPNHVSLSRISGMLQSQALMGAVGHSGHVGPMNLNPNTAQFLNANAASASPRIGGHLGGPWASMGGHVGPHGLAGPNVNPLAMFSAQAQVQALASLAQAQQAQNSLNGLGSGLGSGLQAQAHVTALQANQYHHAALLSSAAAAAAAAAGGYSPQSSLGGPGPQYAGMHPNPVGPFAPTPLAYNMGPGQQPLRGSASTRIRHIPF